MWRGSPAWTDLKDVRRLPSFMVTATMRREQVKEGPHASAWFAHRDHEGRLTGIEICGPSYRDFSAGGDKTLFRLPGAHHRLSAARNPTGHDGGADRRHEPGCPRVAPSRYSLNE
jgi:hypothetical protein